MFATYLHSLLFCAVLLPPFTFLTLDSHCQYYTDAHEWKASDLPEWNAYEDKAADGKTHDNAVHMAINNVDDLCAYRVDYLLGSEYKIFNGSFMLDEQSKSTTSNATLRIYGDEKLIWEGHSITGGLVPQSTGDISVKNVDKLSFEFISDYYNLGNYHGHAFGVVFYDSILK